MKISRRSRDGDLEVRQTSQSVRQTRRLRPNPIIIRNTHSVDVGEKLLRLGDDELFQSFGAGFLHSFEDHPEIDGEGSVGFLVSFDEIQPGEDGSFVVGGSCPRDVSLRQRVMKEE